MRKFSLIFRVHRAWFLCSLLIPFSAGAVQGQDYLSPEALVADTSGESVYIAFRTGNAVARYDIHSGTCEALWPLVYPPTGIAISPDGTRLFVTEDRPEGNVQVLDAASGTVLNSIRVGHTPVSPVVSSDGKTLFVCNRFDNTVSIIDLQTGQIPKSLPLIREPIASALSPDGKWLAVANHLPDGPANQGMIASEITLVDTQNREVTDSIALPNGSTSLRGICISPDGRFAYATHILGRYNLPTTQLDRGWMNTNAVSVIDIPGRKWVNTFLLDNIDLGAANPWGIACSPDGKWLLVGHSGTHELSLIDRDRLHRKLEETQEPEVVPNDLAFLVGLRERIPLRGKGPRGLAAIGNRVIVAEYFSDSLGVVDLLRPKGPKAKSIALSPQVPMSELRKGEFLFHDGEVCFQKWQSCATCHPDARADALNWDLLNDGMGTPKNTKNMLLAHRTPPTSMVGARENAEKSVRSGFRYIEFNVLPEEDAQTVDVYLKSLEPVPSPRLAQGTLSPSALRGKSIFEKAQCATCHPAPLFTDLNQYDVGTGEGIEEGIEFDTPTLIECWRTAPYLYDGRAATMREVFQWHGEVENLSAQEMEDLIEYVLSL